MAIVVEAVPKSPPAATEACPGAESVAATAAAGSVGGGGGAEAWRDGLTVGSSVIVRKASINQWFPGTVKANLGSRLRVEFWHDGVPSIKAVYRHSPDLRRPEDGCGDCASGLLLGQEPPAEPPDSWITPQQRRELFASRYSTKDSMPDLEPVEPPQHEAVEALPADRLSAAASAANATGSLPMRFFASRSNFVAVTTGSLPELCPIPETMASRASLAAPASPARRPASGAGLLEALPSRSRTMDFDPIPRDCASRSTDETSGGAARPHSLGRLPMSRRRSAREQAPSLASGVLAAGRDSAAGLGRPFDRLGMEATAGSSNPSFASSRGAGKAGRAATLDQLPNFREVGHPRPVLGQAAPVAGSSPSSASSSSGVGAGRASTAGRPPKLLEHSEPRPVVGKAATSGVLPNFWEDGQPQSAVGQAATLGGLPNFRERSQLQSAVGQATVAGGAYSDGTIGSRAARDARAALNSSGLGAAAGAGPCGIGAATVAPTPADGGGGRPKRAARAATLGRLPDFRGGSGQPGSVGKVATADTLMEYPGGGDTGASGKWEQVGARQAAPRIAWSSEPPPRPQWWPVVSPAAAGATPVPPRVGGLVRIRSASAGRCVEAVIVDCKDHQAKVMYFMGHRARSKTIPLMMPLEMLVPDEEGEQVKDPQSDFPVGSAVWVRSVSSSKWCQGTVTNITGGGVQVHFWQHGTSWVRTVPSASPEIRPASSRIRSAPSQPVRGYFRLPAAEPQPAGGASPGAESAEEQGGLAVGAAVRVRVPSSRAGTEVDAVITARNGDRIKVHYFLDGRAHTLTVPRSEVQGILPTGAAVKGHDTPRGAAAASSSCERFRSEH